MFAGQMGCEALNFLLKRLIKEERPKRTFEFPPCCHRSAIQKTLYDGFQSTRGDALGLTG